MKSLLAALAFASTAVAQPPSTSPAGASWMRYPAISPDGKTIVFTYKGDLYKVPSAGGTAIAADDAHRRTTSCRCGVTTASRSRSRPTATATTTSTSSAPTAAKPSASRSTRRARLPYTLHGRRQGHHLRRRAAGRRRESPVPHGLAARALRSARRRRTPDSDSHDARREREAEPRTAQLPYL